MAFDKPFDKERVAAYFSSVATAYNQNNYVLAGRRGKYPDVFRRHEYILQMIEGLEGAALEVGCGTGEMLCALIKRNFKVVGVDLAPGMIEASRARVAERCEGKAADLVVGDVENLGFRDGAFDLIVAGGVIEYLESDEKVLHHFRRLLKPGGIVVLSVRNKLNLSRILVTTRDLLSSLPPCKAFVHAASNFFRRLFALTPNTGVPGRRHVPWQLKQRLRLIGLEPRDYAFYQFSVLPRFIERRLPNFAVRCEERLEVFSHSPLGYFANQYLIKAQKVQNGDHRP